MGKIGEGFGDVNRPTWEELLPQRHGGTEVVKSKKLNGNLDEYAFTH
jgi:hypothetical protein